MCRSVLHTLLALPLLFASFWAIRFAYADFLFRSGSTENIRRAAELAPLNAEYQARAGNLQRAVELNPYLSSAWLDLGIAAEIRGDVNEAERYLLEAARVDQTFDPRWTLANFYFRRDNPEEFWKWLRLAAERSYGDRTALFRLASRMTHDPAETQRKAIPADTAILEAWLGYLIVEQKIEAIPDASAALLRSTSGSSRAVLLKACEELLRARRSSDAVGVWNGMIQRKLLTHSPLNPESGKFQTNADLSVEPIGGAFDWRLLWREGVDSRWSRAREIRIGLNGKQLEQTDLLEQLAPVLPNRDYLLGFQYRTDGLAAKPGLRWRVMDAYSSQVLAEASLKSGDCQQQTVAFRAPNGCTLVRLQLIFRRVPGTIRQEGTIVFGGAFNLSLTR